MSGQWNAADALQATLNARWEVGRHCEQSDGMPTWFVINARHGQREGDVKTVTGLITFTYRADPLSPVKTEYFRKLAQKICDDHNAALDISANPYLSRANP